MSKFTSIAKTIFTPIALCVALAFATPADAHKGKDKNHQEMRQLLSELNLSAEQKQDIRQLIKQTREDRDVFKEDTKSLNQSLRALVQSAQWQQSEVENIIAQQQTFLATRGLEQATNKHQVWSLLSEAQQIEFAEKLVEHNTQREDANKGDHRKGRGFKRLNLTDEQKAIIAAIKATAKTEMQPIKINIVTFKQAEHKLIQSPDFNTQAWQNLWEQYKADFASAKIAKAKVQYDVWNTLTPEQQAKAEDQNKRSKKSK